MPEGAPSSHHADHDHGHGPGPGHRHLHGLPDPDVVATARGIWAVKWSFVGLFVTALLQLAIVGLSGSVVLLADTIHNFGAAATAIPLSMARRCRSAALSAAMSGGPSEG